MIKLTPFDIQNHLTTEKEIAAYLDAVFEQGDLEQIKRAFGQVARARSMSKIASDTKLSRESLYKSLTETGNPEFSTMFKVLEALGLRFSVVKLS